MALYSAYFDDSGHPDNARYLTVAGCVADDQQWVHFEREWLELLSRFNTRIFHAVDFEQGKAPFDRLTETERSEFLRLLIGIITRRAEKSFAHIIPINEYRSINERFVF